MKTYDLEVEELREFEGGHMGWWSKGHQDAGAFIAWIPEELQKIDFASPEQYVRHEYWRCVPVGPGEKGVLFVKAKPNTRGAFPVTVIED